ncbi:MAG: MBL fold metallo-hydrolase [Bosea sp.]|jgi:glyoxylase-like metal-dependent hydrolase (beta-lactamase superfamily II)|nr:MBL fold metallo-hydrolase [Bosea sp. (in: a-proteobacteria)]
MAGPAFASHTDLSDKTVSFTTLGEGLHAYTAEGDPNTGIIIGDDSCMVIDAQATPLMAADVIARVRAVTDKPVKYVLLSHYHAVRVLGASAYGASEIIAHENTRRLIVERGAEDMASEIGRFPRLFRGKESIPGLTWPTLTFEGALTLWLGKRRVEISHPGRGHTAGDTIAWVPDAGVLFSGDLVEYRSACYCGDAFLGEWPATIERLRALRPQALMPGRGDALVGPEKVRAAMDGTSDFLTALFGVAQRSVARGLSLKETATEVRKAMDGPFGSYAIYEHCLPFNVSRAWDEARGIAWPRIWTDERDVAMWKALQA